MISVHFGKLTNHKILLFCGWYMSYHAKQTPEFHWVTARGYIRVTEDKTIFMVKILSLPFVCSPMSPLQKSGGCRNGQILAYSQCLLKMSAGLDLPSFQLNWRYPAAMGPVSQINCPTILWYCLTWS